MLKANWIFNNLRVPPSPLLMADRPALILAPMEGVTDAPMRRFQGELQGFDYCVSEFIRVSQEILPRKVFRAEIPEILNPGCRTLSGLPVQVQLLGGDPEKLAESARRAVELGAPGIDLNFGCPAPTVNRHDGGAALLKFPQRIRAIVEAVRAAIPRTHPVSAKLRLGWDDPRAIHENADRAAEGGASWITIHGRTKVQGYMPPAYWGPIGEVRRRLSLPVVANGEIWNLEDFRRCRIETGCIHFMIGRGALADPTLAPRLRVELGLLSSQKLESRLKRSGALDSVDPFSPERWLPWFQRFAEIGLEKGSNDSRASSYILKRIKQWLKYAAMGDRLSGGSGVIPWFEEFKRIENLEEFFQALEIELIKKANRGSVKGVDGLKFDGRNPNRAAPSFLNRDVQSS